MCKCGSHHCNIIFKRKLSGNAPVNQGLDFITATLTWLEFDVVGSDSACERTHSDAIMSILLCPVCCVPRASEVSSATTTSTTVWSYFMIRPSITHWMCSVSNSVITVLVIVALVYACTL
jgi:hypothetical protein